MIDWAQVDELRDDMGDAFADIVAVFLEEVTEGLAQLDDCNDDGALAAGLHFLKGAALNLGFRDFATLCAEGEHQANAGRGGQVDLAAIRRCHATSREQFLAGLAQRAA
ncbi:MAG: Hpt domain-containing protein [Rhodobacter sp.]|nr:Hpt domain-containing protein [Paracoccaceae bacterium]MCC0081200.1 Hpt domain-containing protein [Rhodobacter sp.]